MPRSSKTSAGLLLFRRKEGIPEVFLAHPGGPFWKNKNEGAWSIPKGVVEAGEDVLDAAVREFKEETGIDASPPYVPLGSVRQKAGKVVLCWAWEGDADADKVVSNTMRVEWPFSSGRWIVVPEVDRCGWYSLDEARRLLNPAQAEFIERLQDVLRG